MASHQRLEDPLITQEVLDSEAPDTIDRPLLAWGILILLSFVWGASFILIKKALLTYEPTELATLRVAITCIAFLPFLIYHFRNIPWGKWKLLAINGFAGSAVPAFLFALAETEISSSVAGILNSLTPLFALIIGFFVFKITVGPNKIIGVFVGFSGAALLILKGQDIDLTNNAYGLYIVIACICYASSVNIVKHYFQDVPPIPLAAATFSFIGIPALGYLFYAGTFTKFATADEVWLSFGAVCILAIACTFFASILFFKLVQLTNVIFSSTVAYIIPLTAILLGFFDGESITFYHFIGMGMILTGVYLSKEKKVVRNNGERNR